jgi:glycogen operon protein
VGPGGYQVGNFPPQWTEWNGRYRDLVRDYWRGEPHSSAEFANRLTGSSDLYQNDGRAPYASINFVTAHDGFTMRDLVSYNEKHNEANGEGNNDGESHNRSWNCGVEGPTDDPVVLALRAQQHRNLLTTMLVSQGVPMILHGDELGRTQRGNNNVYCQDSELSWIDWSDVDENLLDFTRKLIALRTGHPVFQRRRFLTGQADSNGVPDIAWLRPDGTAMADGDWLQPSAGPLTVFLNGDAITEHGPRGEEINDDSFLLLFNPSWKDADLTLPGEKHGWEWHLVLDTAQPPGTEIDDSEPVAGGKQRHSTARSVAVLRRV